MNGIPLTYHGKPLIHAWDYRTTDGLPLGVVGRYQNGSDKKDIVPFFKRNGSGWIAGIELNPRPLFGLSMLAPLLKPKLIFVVEGEKAAAALQSMGISAVTSLGGSQAAKQADWSVLNGYKLVYLMPDRDEPGERYMKDVYQALAALEQPPVVKLLRLDGLPEKGDVVDWVQALVSEWNGYTLIPEIHHDGLKNALRDELQNAEPVPESWLNNPAPPAQSDYDDKPIEPFELVPAPELTAQHVSIDWLVENILERGSLNLLFGEPSAGKSLIALDWAFCTAGGIDWHDHRTKQIDVVIVAGEGHVGIKRRLKALEVKYDRKAPEMLFISQRPAQLSDPVNAQWVADSIKAKCKNPGLVIIDTLHRNMDGDENSSQDIGQFINNIDMFIRPLGAAVLIVHHSGHGPKDRSRGSSSIRAAMDGEFLATKHEGSITLTCCKAKDFEALAPLQFTLKPVKLDWLDNDGEPMNSVYLEYEGTAMPGTKRRKLSARDSAILTSLDEATAANGVIPTNEIRLKFGGFDSMMGKLQKIVHIDHWRQLAYKAITVDSGKDENAHAKKMAFKRCRDKLFNGGFTVEYGDYAWRVFDS